MHDPYMHRFMHSEKGLLNKVADNPHISCEVFVRKLKDLFKYYLDDGLDVLWKWLRYEIQNRYAIHAHVLLKLLNEPFLEAKIRGKDQKFEGLAQIGKCAIKGWRAGRKMKKIKRRTKEEKEEYKGLRSEHEACKKAERLMCDYAESLHFLAGAFEEFKSKQQSKDVLK